jgi:hypothetical protein
MHAETSGLFNVSWNGGMAVTRQLQRLMSNNIGIPLGIPQLLGVTTWTEVVHCAKTPFPINTFFVKTLQSHGPMGKSGRRNSFEGVVVGDLVHTEENFEILNRPHNSKTHPRTSS